MCSAFYIYENAIVSINNDNSINTCYRQVLSIAFFYKLLNYLGVFVQASVYVSFYAGARK